MSPTVFGTFCIVLLLPTHNGCKLWKKRASRLERRHLWHIVEVCFYIVAGRNMNSLMVSVRTETTYPSSGDDHLPGELGLQLSP